MKLLPNRLNPLCILLQILVLILCLWDIASTYYIVSHHIAPEINPLVAYAISTIGWFGIIFIKLVLAILLAYTVPFLLQLTWAKYLLCLFLFTYFLVAIAHVYLIFLLQYQ